MNRRQFIRQMAIGTGPWLLLPKFGCNRETGKPPNILFLFADDQCHEALSCFGTEVQTPNLDRLVANGVIFTDAYNQGAWHGAVCIASRTMLVTGRFLWHARAIESTLDHEVEKGHLWPQYLSKAGYDTYMAGKWHVQIDPEAIFGTTGHIRGGMPNQTEAGYNRPIDEADYINGWKPWDMQYGGFWEGGKHWSEVLGDESIDFLQDAAKSEKPFFMYLAFNAPHDPRQSPEEYVNKYPLENVEVPENFLPEYPYKDAIGCSEELRDERLAPFPRTEYAVKVNRQEYYAIITHMDTQVGRILDALEKSGKKDNTYIFFTADHGLAIGHHGLMGKQNLFEHSLKAPLIVNGPDIPKGKQINSPIYIQDIMPTTLELAGMKKPEQVQFKSFLPLISGDRKESYKAIYGGYMEVQRMVRKDNYKLIFFPTIKKTLLFDLENDPEEMHDLALYIKYEPVVQDLIQTLQKLQEEVGDTLRIEP